MVPGIEQVHPGYRVGPRRRAVPSRRGRWIHRPARRGARAVAMASASVPAMPSPSTSWLAGLADAVADAMADAMADVVLPRECAGCGRPGADACPRCRRALLGRPGRWHLGAAPGAGPGAPPVVVAGPYAAPASDLLAAYKERGRRGLAGDLGLALAGAVLAARHLACTAHLGQEVALVTIPASRSALARRGEDVAALLADAAATRLRRAGVPARRRAVLAESRARLDQAGLDARARHRNAEGSLVARGRVRQGCVIVVDDVVTTGATALAAVSALAAVGTPACAVAAMLGTAPRPRASVG